MKKYIGITIYLIGIILLSYSFFNITRKKEKDDFKNIALSGKNSLTNFIMDKTGNSEKNTGSLDNFVSGLEIVPISKANLGETGTILSGTRLTGNIVPNELLIGHVVLKKINVNPYSDIYELLGYSDLPTYVVEGKDIYVKKLKSVDYKLEKDNIQQLIQQIGGNIKETNLFGEKQLFVNPDVYYGKVVIMLVKYDKSLYLLTFPYDKYVNYKSYIKKILFN